MRNVIALALIASALTGCIVANPESGDKIGQIAKVQTEGVICSTVGILVTGKYGGGELKLTVPNGRTDLLEKVRLYNDSQAFVKVTYHTEFIASACSNDSGNTFLDSVELHPEGEAK